MSKQREDATLTVGGKSTIVTATVTRPANTDAYAAGDQVCNSTTAPVVITFGNVGVYELPGALGASGIIINAVMIDSANVSTKPDFDLYLFSSSVTPNNDNAAWAPSDADMNSCIGLMNFATFKIGTVTSGADGNCLSHVNDLSIPFVCGAGVRDIYGLLVARASYTPVSGEIFKISLGIIQD